ncbi:MAG: NAD(P)/FAD-dependent oxidoreductase [Ferruginibacter sp.]|nr:NAD(P)/FAD-dependent oxidoreductase [Cytophagales bacterium]
MKIVVIGGGAAGFFGAITGAETFPDHQVTVLEKSRHLLSKVRISGGGRCNVTHANSQPRQFAQHYPRGNQVMPSLLQQFDAARTVDWFRDRGVALKTEPDGRLFPVTDQSETIVQCLVQAAQRAGVQVRTSCGVKAVTTSPNDPRFSVHLLDDTMLAADRVLIATGGHPQAQGYDWLANLPPAPPSAIQLPVPSLFTFHTPTSPLLELAGVSVPKVVVKIEGTPLTQEGPLLLTHWGFSGPSILKLSAWGARALHERQYRFTLLVNWLPHYHGENLREKLTEMRTQHRKKTVAAQVFSGEEAGRLPQRLWRKLVAQAGIGEELRWADLPNKNLNKLTEALTRSRFAVAGKSTYKEEFVTCGGVSLSEIDPRTMESRHCPGLYFAGEVLDIDGVTGGFNFQSAWTTGYIAGKNLGN